MSFPMMPVRLNASTAIQNTMTVAVPILMFAPHDGKWSCLRNTYGAESKAPKATPKVTGLSRPNN